MDFQIGLFLWMFISASSDKHLHNWINDDIKTSLNVILVFSLSYEEEKF